MDPRSNITMTVSRSQVDHSAFQNRQEPTGTRPFSSDFPPVPASFQPDPTGKSTEKEAVFLHGNHRTKILQIPRKSLLQNMPENQRIRTGYRTEINGIRL